MKLDEDDDYSQDIIFNCYFRAQAGYWSWDIYAKLS
jgi:hypothetical protein